jgi:hypothetical protein
MLAVSKTLNNLYHIAKRYVTIKFEKRMDAYSGKKAICIVLTAESVTVRSALTKNWIFILL